MEILQKNKVNIENAMHLIKLLFYLHKMHTYTARMKILTHIISVIFLKKLYFYAIFFHERP
jgi:hypothetical protein